MPASGVIFNGNTVKTLKSKININDQSSIEAGSADPTATPTIGTYGSKYIDNTSGIWYRSFDLGGSHTNWETMLSNQGPDLCYNVGVKTTVSGGALTISLTNADGAGNPSTTTPCYIAFRSSDPTTGGYVVRKSAAATNLTVPSGGTLGMADATLAYLYVYAIDNAATIVLGVSRMYFDPGTVVNTTAISNASSSNSDMYSDSNLSGVSQKLIARVAITEATAGTWASNASEIAPASTFLTIPKITARYGTAGSMIIAPSTNTVIEFDTLFNDFYQTVSYNLGPFWVFTAPKARDYRLWSKLTINNATWNSPNSIVYSILKNGVSEAYIQQFQWGFTTDAVFSPEGSLTAQLAVGDTISFAFYHDNVSNVTTQNSPISCYMCIEEV